MLWLYVILGLVAFASAAEGLLRGRARSPHVVSILLVAIAWFAQHLTPLGWAAMIAGVFLEAAARAWARRRTSAERAPGPSDSNIVAEETLTAGPAPGADEPASVIDQAAPVRPDLVVRSLALLAAPASVGVEILVAALRRSGEREALLDRGSDAGPCMRIGAMQLTLRCLPQPLAARLLRPAAAHTWDWPEAGSAVESHAAQIEITIRAPGDTPPARIVHRHAQAMAALGEFARVIAVCWPEAPRLMRPPQDPMPGESAIDPTRSCVAFRDARPSGASPEASGHVCDSIGLHAFGLPDVEVATDGPPAKETTALLYDLARRIFRAGATLETEALLTVTECGQWSIQEARSTLAPERDVLRVTARMQASTDPAES